MITAQHRPKATRARPAAALTVALAAALTTACSDDGANGANDPGSAKVITTTVAPTTTTTSGNAATANTSTDAIVATTEPTQRQSSTSSGTSTTGTPTTEEAATEASTTRASASPSSSSTDANDASLPAIRVVTTFTGLDQPLDLAVRPGDDAFYVAEQRGRVIRFGPDEPSGGTVVADITDRTASEGERGLLGLAFSPDGSTAYFDYSNTDTDAGEIGATIVAAAPVDTEGMIDVARLRTILRVDQPYSNHNGGDLEFGPDGMLYITLGDGGSAGDPERRASDPTSLLGSLLRIDPTPAADDPYRVPPDNPFSSGVDANGRRGAPEVWSWGLRNPWKIAFDPVDASLWIADVGQAAVEEVDHVVPTDGHGAGYGVNFGWSGWEGDERFNDDVPEVGAALPVIVYDHGPDGCSISGGVPYRGDAIADLDGAYLYSDFCSGKLWGYQPATGEIALLAEGLGKVAAVRTGPDEETYVIDRDGTVGRVAPAS